MTLNNHKWTISTVIAVFAILIPVVLYLIAQTDKQLTYRVMSKSDLIGTNISIENIEIKISGEPISKAAIYLIKLKNSGTEPIKANDFEKPLAIEFPNDSKIFNTNIKNKIPNNINLEYKINKNILLIEPFLFNPDEEFEIEILSSSEDYPNLNSRISNISEPEQVFPGEKSNIKTLIKYSMCFMLLLFYAKSFKLTFSKEKQFSGTSSRSYNAALAITCGFASGLILESISNINITDKLYIALSFIPIAIGLFLAMKAEKYNKSLEQDAG